MSDKIKSILFLLFIVSVLLLMIGSVNAINADEINNNLETSQDLNDELSVSADDSQVSSNNLVSNQLTVSNVDSEPKSASSIDDNLTALNSNVGVSNKYSAAINSKDSENNILTAGGSNIVIEYNKVLTPVVRQGYTVSFEIVCRNTGDNHGTDEIPITILYSHEELEYLGFTPCLNPDNGWNYSSCFSQIEHNFDQSKVVIGYTPSSDFQRGHCFKFTVQFKAIKLGENGCYAYANNFNGGIPARAKITDKPYFDLSNTALKNSVSVGSIVSFEIFGRNLGTNFGETYVPINIRYGNTELEYIGFIPGRNPDTGFTYECYSEEIRNDDDGYIKIGYGSNGWFDYGHCFNLTVQFKALKPGDFGCFAYVDDWNAGKATRVNITQDSNFNLTITPSKDLTVVGSDISYEIFARNIGSNFTQEYIPIDIYYDSSKLSYTGFTVGRNPDNGWVSTDNYKRPVEYYGDHVRVYYYSNRNFLNGHCLNFTAHFKALNESESTRVVAVINWIQTDSHQVYSISEVPIKRDSDFKLEYKSKSAFANVEDDVSFEVVTTNLGPAYNEDYVYVKVKYNPDELEYAGFAPGRNIYDGLYYEDYYLTPIVNATKGEVLFGYFTNSSFQQWHNFNFTVNFKSLKQGKVATTASIDWEQFESHHVEATSQPTVTDANFVLENTPITKVVSLGDNASFKITARNLQGAYYGSGIGFDLFYDPNNMEYVDYNVIRKPNGNFKLESIDTKLTKRSEGLLSASKSEDGHIHFAYTPTSGANGDCSFEFDVNFKALQTGNLQSTADLSWTKSEAKKVSALGLAYAGESGLNLTKKVHEEFVSVGDDVYYDVCLINNGTVPLYNSTGCFFVKDYYPEGLVFLGYEAHTPGITITHDAPWSYVGIRQALPSDGCWAPGSVLNVTLHFKAEYPGILCNWVFGPDGQEVYSSVIVNETDLNLTKTVREEFVQLNELVYFNIYVKNTGEIPYYNHYNSTKDLVIYDYYPEGLTYEGYEIVSDSQGGKFNVKTGDDNRLNITYTPNAEKWYSGSYINVTLIFNATKYGKLTNKANVRWIWKDWDEFQEIDLWDNATVTVYEPQFSITKISNYDLVEIGKPANFTIIVTNTGKVNLTGVYIKDNNYTEGLVYSDYSDKALWTFDGKDTWNYTKTLNVGESARLELTFLTTTVGEKINTAVAGHNITDEVLNSTDKVNVRSIVSLDFDVKEPKGIIYPAPGSVPTGDVLITVPDDVPDVDLPDDKVPTVDVPDVDLPDDKVSAADVPDVDLPDDKVSAADVPDVDIPDRVSVVDVPDVDLPDDVVSVVDVPDTDIPDVNFVDGDVPINKATDDDDPEVELPSEIPSFDVYPDGNRSAEKFPTIGVPEEVPPDEEIPPVEVPEEDPSEENLTDEIPDVDVTDDIHDDGIKNDTKKDVVTKNNVETKKAVNEQKPAALKKTNQPVTGNPLFALILCLISLCFVQIKTKK